MSEPFCLTVKYYSGKAGEIAIDFTSHSSRSHPIVTINKGIASLLMAALTFPKFLLILQVSFANEKVHWSNTAPIRWPLANTLVFS